MTARLAGFLSLTEEFMMPEQNSLPIDQMSFSDIAYYVGQINDQTTAVHGTALTRRLYEIALYDHHLPDSHREGALKLLKRIKRIMEIHYERSPNSLLLYRVGNTFMEETAGRVGMGSLAWLILEKGPMSDAKFVQFVTLPEHRKLLPNFYSILGPELAMRLNEALAQIQPKQHGRPSYRKLTVNGVGRFILTVLGAVVIGGSRRAGEFLVLTKH
jgi:hypothetical protein